MLKLAIHRTFIPMLYNVFHLISYLCWYHEKQRRDYTFNTKGKHVKIVIQLTFYSVILENIMVEQNTNYNIAFSMTIHFGNRRRFCRQTNMSPIVRHVPSSLSIPTLLPSIYAHIIPPQPSAHPSLPIHANTHSSSVIPTPLSPHLC